MAIAEELGYAQGREAGYAFGMENGRRQGLADTWRSRMQQVPAAKFDLRVLYVTSGIGPPYPPIDKAVSEALAETVREVAVAGPGEPVGRLAAELKPDLMLALNGTVLPESEVRQVRESGTVTAIWFTDDPYYTDWTANIAPRYDFVFTLERACVPFYRSLGCARVHHLPFAADPAVFNVKPAGWSCRSDICFLGTAYWDRVRTIDRLARYLAERRTVIAGLWWDRLRHFQLLKPYIFHEQWLSPEQSAEYYNGAKIAINLHRSATDPTINHNGRKIEALSVNPRTFEICACQTLQLVDGRDDVALHYVPGREIVCFHSDDELMELLDYYLNHDEERREIAFRGYLRTMRDHTYRVRVGELIRLVVRGDTG